MKIDLILMIIEESIELIKLQILNGEEDALDKIMKVCKY